MSFAVKRETCMGCRTLVADKDKVPGSPLCRNCAGKEAELYTAKLSELNAHQQVVCGLHGRAP